MGLLYRLYNHKDENGKSFLLWSESFCCTHKALIRCEVPDVLAGCIIPLVNSMLECECPEVHVYDRWPSCMGVEEAGLCGLNKRAYVAFGDTILSSFLQKVPLSAEVKVWNSAKIFFDTLSMNIVMVVILLGLLYPVYVRGRPGVDDST
eukprot:1389633-Ditylum_brightwellii.AAC.1